MKFWFVGLVEQRQCATRGAFILVFVPPAGFCARTFPRLDLSQSRHSTQVSSARRNSADFDDGPSIDESSEDTPRASRLDRNQKWSSLVVIPGHSGSAVSVFGIR
jgi:hypothetical protein